MFDNMFENTRGAIDIIASDLRRMLFFIVAVIQLGYIGYLTYNIITDKGVLSANIIFVSLFSLCLIAFFILCGKGGEDLSGVNLIKYPIVRLKTTIKELEATTTFFGVFLQLLYISFAVTSIVGGKGILAINIALICISVAYLAFLFFTGGKEKKETKELGKRAKNWCKWSKILVSSINIGFAVYGITITAGDVSFEDATMLAIMVAGWLFGILIQLITHYIDKRISDVLKAFEADKQGSAKAVFATVDIAKKVVAKGAAFIEGADRVKGFFKNRFLKSTEPDPADDEEDLVHK